MTPPKNVYKSFNHPSTRQDITWYISSSLGRNIYYKHYYENKLFE